jgi:hypothetical protein
MDHFRKSFTPGWMENHGGDRQDVFFLTTRRMLHDHPDVLVLSLTSLARMGSQTAFSALYSLRRVSRQLHDHISRLFLPHIVNVPRNVRLNIFALIPLHLQHRWMQANPGRDIPGYGWNMYRSLDSFHARTTKSGRTYAEIRATDELMARSVARAQPDRLDLLMVS